GRGVARGDVQVEGGHRGAEADVSRAAHVERMSRRSGRDREHVAPGGGVLDGEVTGPSTERIVCDEPPVIVWEGTDARVLKEDAQVVLLQLDGVKAEGLFVNAIQA